MCHSFVFTFAKSRFSYDVSQSMREKKTKMWFPNRSIKNQVVQAQRWLEAGSFGFRKKRNCNIRVAKTKALISFAVTAKLICAFVFAYEQCWFSHDKAHLSSINSLNRI